MIAIMASICFVHAAHAASDAAPKQSLKSPAGHGKFTALQQDLRSGPEVTKARRSCHTEAAKQKLNASNRRTPT